MFQPCSYVLYSYICAALYLCDCDQESDHVCKRNETSGCGMVVDTKHREVMMIGPGQNYDHWLFLETLEVLLRLVIPD